ncbi:MAG: hypothetical protein ACXWC9_06060, partial [Pseudobdellovibrionaceae bacterium]
MSQLLFQQQELVARFGSEVTLGEIFLQIENDLKALSEVVCQFKVNGLALDEQGEKRLASVQLGELQTLEVFSQQPRAILGDVLTNWVKQIPALIERNDELAGLIRFKGVEGQLKSLVELIDQCQLLIDSIISIDSVFPELMMVQSEKWKKAQKQTASAIGEALQAFQKKDFNWLADILEYDLGHSLQTWMEHLDSMKQDL